jgi:hypothetical protein
MVTTIKSIKEDEMKAQTISKRHTWALSAGVLAALVYSVLGLTLSAKPAYAQNGCTAAFCDELTIVADGLCQDKGLGTAEAVDCPYDGHNYWVIVCEGGQILADCP